MRCVHFTCFPNKDAVTAAMKQWATFIGADFYKHGMYHWQKFIVTGSDCVEKYNFVTENLLYQTFLCCSLYLL